MQNYKSDLESMEKTLNELVDKIESLNQEATCAAKERQEKLAKPTGALGMLEELSVQLAGITGKVKNKMTKQTIAIFSADNGVVEEGVASAPQSVTYSQTINFTRGLTGVSSMATYFDIDLLVCDMGVKMELPEALKTQEMVIDGKLSKGIVDRSLGNGTENLAKGPAMTKEQAVKGILTGIETAEAVKTTGYDILGVGEMGIGNTTTSACVLSALTGLPSNLVVGRGGGLNDEGLKKKIKIVESASRNIEKQLGLGEATTDKKEIEKRIDNLQLDQVVEILRHVGGFDICAMVGAYLGAAIYKIPVVIDGYISIVAALAAKAINSKTAEYMIGSHKSTEPGYVAAISALGIEPLFDLKMRLGEGSGCPISFKIVETACATMNKMATYDEGQIDADYLDERKEGNFF